MGSFRAPSFPRGALAPILQRNEDHCIVVGCGEVHFAGLSGKAGKGGDLAALFLSRKALPSQCKGTKFLLERGGLEIEKL